MLRVLLKVDQVSMRIKETVQIHLVIRKGVKNFTHSRNHSLQHGELTLDSTSEFFVEREQPFFDIEIYLLMGDLKKRGGVVHLNLLNYAINTSHRIQAPIEDSPLHHSKLLIDFVYMQAGEGVPHSQLVSLN